MAKRIRWLLPASLVLLIAVACAPAAPAQPQPAKPAAPAPQAEKPTAADPEQVWQELVEAARPEGRLVISATSPQVREQVGPAFTNRFGIDAEIVIGRGGENAARLEAERSAGIHSTDLVFGGITTFANVMYAGGWFVPIQPQIVHPDALDPSKWREGGVPYGDPDEQYILRTLESVQNLLTYNPEFIDAEALIQTSDDLLRPELRGKMSTDDPTTAGSGSQTSLYFLLHKGDEFVRRLYVDQEPGIAEDQRQVADWFARGIYPIMMTPREEDVVKLIEDGFQVRTMWPADIPPMAATGGAFVAALDQGPNPNATKLFLNWFLSQEGQQVFSESQGRPSLRVDTEPRGIPEFSIPQPGVEYFSADDWDFRTLQYDERLERIRELVGIR